MCSLWQGIRWRSRDKLISNNWWCRFFWATFLIILTSLAINWWKQEMRTYHLVLFLLAHYYYYKNNVEKYLNKAFHERQHSSDTICLIYSIHIVFATSFVWPWPVTVGDGLEITPAVQRSQNLEGTFSYCVYEGKSLVLINDLQAFCVIPIVIRLLKIRDLSWMMVLMHIR